MPPPRTVPRMFGALCASASLATMRMSELRLPRAPFTPFLWIRLIGSPHGDRNIQTTGSTHRWLRNTRNPVGNNVTNDRGNGGDVMLIFPCIPSTRIRCDVTPRGTPAQPTRLWRHSHPRQEFRNERCDIVVGEYGDDNTFSRGLHPTTQCPPRPSPQRNTHQLRNPMILRTETRRTHSHAIRIRNIARRANATEWTRDWAHTPHGDR